MLYAILLLCGMIGSPVALCAQENPQVPMLKIKKKPRPNIRLKKADQKKTVKDRYRPPATKSTSGRARDRYTPPQSQTKEGKVRDSYRRPRSKSNHQPVRDNYQKPRSLTNNEKANVKDGRGRSAPSYEEGQAGPRPTFWQRILHRNHPATDAGNIALGKREHPHPGTGYVTNPNRKNINFEQQSAERHQFKGHTKRKRLPRFLEQKLAEDQEHQYTQHSGQLLVPKPGLHRRQQSGLARQRAESQGPIYFLRPSQRKQKQLDLKESETVSQHRGAVKERTPQHQTRFYKQQAKAMHGHQGVVRARTPKHQTRFHEQQAKDIHGHQGIVKVRTPKHQTRFYEQQARDIHGHKGQFRVRTQQHQTRFYEQQARDIHGFAGRIRVRTPAHQTRYFKQQSRDIHQFNGLLRVRKPQKDMHPSVNYLKSKTKKSFEQKEQFRKWTVQWHRLFKGKEQPKHLKLKTRKPRYDKEESEIWYY